MRTLYKTKEVVQWLYAHDCDETAATIHDYAEGAEFLDSSVLRKHLIFDLYETLENEINKHTYKTKSIY